MVKELTSAAFNSDTGTLTLNFSDNLTAIDAGKPYIVKWVTSTPTSVEDPMFKDITIDITNTPTDIADVIIFQGIYSPDYKIINAETTAVTRFFNSYCSGFGLF